MPAEEDTILFDDCNKRIHDEFARRMEIALVDGVASLPLMTSSGAGSGAEVADAGAERDEEDEDGSRQDKMLQRLRKVYLRNIDLAELYNERNSFSVAKRTSHFRKRIVERFLAAQQQQQESDGEDKNRQEATTKQQTHSSNDDNDNSTVDQDESNLLLLPAKQEDIATPEQLKQLQEEINTLRAQLENARKIRQQKLQQCQAMEEAAAFSQQAQDTLINHDATNTTLAKVSSQVETMIQAQQEYYGDLKPRGQQLIAKMDQLKNNENQNDDHDNNNQIIMDDKILSSPATKKTKKLTLEEQYQQEHRNVLGETQKPTDLFALRDLLMNKS